MMSIHSSQKENLVRHWPDLWSWSFAIKTKPELKALVLNRRFFSQAAINANDGPKNWPKGSQCVAYRSSPSELMNTSEIVTIKKQN